MKIQVSNNEIWTSLGTKLRDSLKFKKRLQKEIYEKLDTTNHIKKLVYESFKDPAFKKTVKELFFRYTSVKYNDRFMKDLPSTFKVAYAPKTILMKNYKLAQLKKLGRNVNPKKHRVGLYGKSRKFKPNAEGDSYLEKHMEADTRNLTILYDYGDFRKQLMSNAFINALCFELSTGKYTELEIKRKKMRGEDSILFTMRVRININNLLYSPSLEPWAVASKYPGARNSTPKATFLLRMRHSRFKYDMFSSVVIRSIFRHYKGLQ